MACLLIFMITKQRITKIEQEIGNLCFRGGNHVLLQVTASL